LIHPEISGNKWRKLNLNFEKYHQDKYEKFLTFGGAYSNHIAATASAGKIFGINTIGIIRGDELSKDSNSTMQKAHEDGMELFFVSREEYARRHERYYHEELRRRHGNALIVAEGGANYLGMIGCVEILGELQKEPDYIITACGTGTTTAGLLLGSQTAKIISVQVLKNAEFIKEDISQLLSLAGLNKDLAGEYMDRLIIEPDFHFGGYGKVTEELIDFINIAYKEFKIAFDQIYTGKMLCALMNMVECDRFKKGDSVVVLHTGGLQGLSSIQDKSDFQITISD